MSSIHSNPQSFLGWLSTELVAELNGELSARFRSSFASLSLASIFWRNVAPTNNDASRLSSTEEESLIASAKLVAQQDGRKICETIQDYGITNQAALIDIAKLVAQRHGFEISKYIKNFGITSHTALIDIAKLAAQQDGFETSHYIKNYGITSQQALIDIAKLAAHSGGVSTHIKKYGITSQEALIDIAKLSVQNDAFTTSLLIKNYGITSQQARVEIAKLAVQQNAYGASHSIKEYAIESQDALVEIAKLAIQKDSRASAYIQNYGITSQDALVEIAKLAVQQNSETAAYIQNYGITSQRDLLEIATLAFKQSGSAALPFLANYDLDLIHRAALIARFVNAIPEITQNMARYFPEKDRMAVLTQYPELRIFGINDNFVAEHLYLVRILSDKRAALHVEMIREADPAIKALKMNMLRVFCSISDFSDGFPSLLQKFSDLFSSIEKESNPHVQQQQLTLIAALIMHCRARNVDKAALEEQFPLFKEVFALQDPSLRVYLSHVFVDHLTDPVLRDFIKKNLSGLPQKKKPCAAADLALLLLAPLITEVDPYVEFRVAANKLHIDPEDILPVSFIQRLQELLNHSYFQRDRMKTKSLLRNLRTLVDAPQLSNTQKTLILRDLIFNRDDLILIKDKNFSKNTYCEQLLRSSEMVAILADCNQVDRLTSITYDQLPDQIPEVFTSVLNIDLPDCNKLVLNTFAKWRKPAALLTYAGRLQSLPKEESEPVLFLLKKYAESVLKGTFTSTRYDTSASNASEHWLKIQQEAPELITEWKKGSRNSEGMFDVVDTDDPCDLLLAGTEVGSCQSVNHDPAYSKCLAAYLMDPKIRMMAVKNKNGVTVARCMMRLLWDKTTKKFVLFQEKKYGSDSPAFAKMLDEACKKRAKDLGIALLVKDENAQGTDVTTLQAFKGNAPFEYVDAHDAEQIQTDAGYEIGQCIYIYRQ